MLIARPALTSCASHFATESNSSTYGINKRKFACVQSLLIVASNNSTRSPPTFGFQVLRFVQYYERQRPIDSIVSNDE